MRQWTLVAGAVATFVSLPAMANDEEPAAEPEKKICKSEAITGTRTRTRTCRTRAQWDELTRATQKALQDSQRNGGANPGTLNSRGPFAQ